MYVAAVSGLQVAAQTGPHTAGHDALNGDLAVEASFRTEAVQDLEHIIGAAAVDSSVSRQLLRTQNIGDEPLYAVGAVIGGTVQGQSELLEIRHQRFHIFSGPAA